MLAVEICPYKWLGSKGFWKFKNNISQDLVEGAGRRVGLEYFSVPISITSQNYSIFNTDLV